MKKFLLLFFLFAAPTFAQQYPQTPNVGLAANRPVNCNAINPVQPNEPDWYYSTDTSALSICIAQNTWQDVSGGGSGGCTVTASAGNLIYTPDGTACSGIPNSIGNTPTNGFTLSDGSSTLLADPSNGLAATDTTPEFCEIQGGQLFCANSTPASPTNPSVQIQQTQIIVKDATGNAEAVIANNGTFGLGFSGAGGSSGSFTLNGATSGLAALGVAAAAGTPCEILLPTVSPTANQVLTAAACTGSPSASQTHWATPAAGGVTSFSGDGALITNSGSTGAVTATVGTAAGHSYWGNNTGSGATAAFDALSAGDIPSGIAISKIGSGGLTAVAPMNIDSTGAITQTKYSGAWFSIQAQLVGNSSALSGANAINITEFDFPATKTFTSIFVEVGTADASGLYSWGICDTSGNILASMASAVHVPSGNTIVFGTVPSTTLQPGHYVFYITGTATTALFGSSGAVFPISSYSSRTAVSTSTSGLASSPITFASSTFTKLGSSLVIGFGLQ